MLKKLRQRTASSGTDFLLLSALMVNTALVQVAVSITRITTSYRAVDLGLSVIWLGVITAGFALLPIIFAVSVGRFIDRGNDSKALWIGSTLLLGVCAAFPFAASPLSLFLCNVALGIGHIFLMASQQMLCLRCARGQVQQMDSVFGTYMVSGAVGTTLGPAIIGYFGGASKVPPTHLLFEIAFGFAVVVFIVSMCIRPGVEPGKENRDAPVVPVRTILNTPGLRAVLFLSVMSVTAIDLIVVYLPILGIERGIDVKDIGLLLSVRACASIVSRLFYARMIRFFGRHPLMISSSFGGAIGFVMLALPVPIWVLVAAVLIVGFTLGIASTLSITGTIDLVGAAGRGTANTLRIMGNRLGQVGMPTLAGLIATAFGVGGVFMIIAGTLTAATASIMVSRPRRAV
jgi:MFS family permease